MAIDPAAPPWTGPSTDALQQRNPAPYAELYECGLFGSMNGAPVSMETHYWPVRSTKSPYKRQVPCKDSSGKNYGAGGRRFGVKRPDKPKPNAELRWHAGVDLGGEYLDMVVACQSGKVVEIVHFTLGTYAVMVQHDCNGLVCSYNEVHNGSWSEFNIKKGSVVVGGQPLARVGLMTGGYHMLHFEMYQTGTKATHSWPQSGPRPEPLRDPTKYLLYLAQHGA